MTISTIITVYNLEKYIEESLESVFKQTRRPDEIIVVDDCSTDRSAEILQKYKDRIKYVRMPENSGVMLAFIRGIEESSGDILSFLDGDDVWLPDKLNEIETAFLADENRVLVTHDYECIDAEGRKRPYSDDPAPENTERIVREANGDPEKMNQLLRNSILCHKGVWLGSAFCLRRRNFDVKKFKEIMCALPDPKLSYQDHTAAAFVLLENKSKKAFFINKILFQYRLFGFNSSGASADLKSALRTVSKYKATTLRTAYLVAQHSELIEENHCQKMRLLDADYLQALYAKSFIKAVPKFVKLSTKFWNWRKSFKEFQRIAGVAVLGPEKFLRLKSK